MKSCHPLFTLPTSMCRSTNTWGIKELDIENQIIVTHIPWKYWYRKYWASRPQIPYQSSTYNNNKIQCLFYDHSFTHTTQLNQLHTPCKIQKQVDTTLNKPCILCEQRKKICAEGLILKVSAKHQTVCAPNLRQDLITEKVGCVILKQSNWPIMIS